MRFRQFGGHRPYVLRLDEGEEILETLEQFLAAHHIRLGYFIAFGGFSGVELDYFNVRTRKYQKRRIDKQLEVVSLLGNVALQAGTPKIHAHCVVGDEHDQTYGGHLGLGTVKPLLEVFLAAIDGELERVEDTARGVHVLKI
jgi:predicted DNA-binding protein with PD1-like motif